ncbi:MAG: hypothetical protein CVU48_09905 [Candidatus Cloacimonetes bacterium HGW-Cloacimonetes-1]|jgi:16S rRNA (uracil1498-N3)-methyltransferase|nr:MAG: hypothetical protein CVU48_09905 [Candidatus Cloacimonetes bacterium HGW-Cloacimonetes-1]
MPSFWVPELNTSSSVLSIADAEFHHIVKVFRHSVGDVILLNSGTGVMANAKITAIHKSNLTVTIENILTSPLPLRPFAIGFSLLRNKNDEVIIEKLTELGVSNLFPIESDRSVRHASKNTVERFNKTAQAAIKQCNNPWLPQISAVQALGDAILSIKSAGYTPFVCSEKLTGTWLSQLAINKDESPCFLVGPEGGWSVKEFALFEELKIRHISICDLVLRAETSAIAIGAQWLMMSHL